MKKKAEIHMSKPVFLGLSKLQLSKILMHEFWYGYLKPNVKSKIILYGFRFYRIPKNR